MVDKEATLPKSELVERSAAWLLVAGVVLIASNLRAPITAVGPLVREIRTDTGLSNTLTGMLTTLPLLAFALISPFASRLGRRFGMQQALLMGLIALAAGIIVRSLPSLVTLFAGTALLGMAIAICNVLLPSFIKQEFPHKVGVMTGLFLFCMAGGAAGGAGLSIPLGRSLNMDWRGVLAVWAILCGLAVVVWLPQVRWGLLSGSDSGAKAPAATGRLRSSRLAWLATLFMGLQSFNFYVVVAWLPEILIDWGVDNASAGFMVSLFQLSGLPAAFIIPVLASRSPNQQRIVVFSVALLLAGFSGLFIANTLLLPLWIAMLGFGASSTFSLALTFFVLRTHNALQAAELSGMGQSIGYLLAATGPTLFGLLHDLTHGWTVPLLLMIVVTLLLLLIGLRVGKNGYVTLPELYQPATN